MNYHCEIKSSSALSVIVPWWKKWKHPVLPLTMLPEYGLRMVSKDEVPLAFAFILLPLDPQCKLALVEWTTANPDIAKPQRREALRFLMDSIAQELGKMGFEFAITYTDSDNFAKTLETELGFIDSKKKYRWLLRATAEGLQGSDVRPQS